MKTVRAGRKYKYEAFGMDIWDCRAETLKDGDIVEVVNLPGCPPANTMRMCHVKKDGVFAGLVLTASLNSLTGESI